MHELHAAFREHVNARLALLPEKFKRPLLLWKAHLSHEEIARELRVDVKEARRRLAKGLATLTASCTGATGKNGE